VKGLTGIDVPALIGTSMGARFGGNGAAPGPASSQGGGGSGPKGGGTGGSGGSGGGERRPTSARTRREPPSPRPAVSQPAAPASPAESSSADASAGAVEAAHDEVGAAMDAAVSEVGRTAQRAREAVDRAIGPATPSRAARSGGGSAAMSGTTARTSTQTATSGSPAVGELGRESTLDEAAHALADDLMRIPGIQRFGGLRLADLDSTGPRPLRTMWRIARDRLQRDYGNLTIGEIIDRYRGTGSGGGEGGEGGVSTNA